MKSPQLRLSLGNRMSSRKKRQLHDKLALRDDLSIEHTPESSPSSGSYSKGLFGQQTNSGSQRRLVKSQSSTFRNVCTPTTSSSTTSLLEGVEVIEDIPVSFSTPDRPILVRRMTSGTLGGDDCIRFDNHHHHHQTRETEEPEDVILDDGLSICSSPASLSKLSVNTAATATSSSNSATARTAQINNKLFGKQESIDETSLETSSISSGEGCDEPILEVLNLSNLNLNEAEKVKKIFASLSEEDKETAARTSWKYYNEVACQASKVKPGSKRELQNRRRRDDLARAMVERHLRGESGDVHTACKKILATLEGRREQKLDWVRTCWHPTIQEEEDGWSPEQVEFARMVRGKMSRWLGPNGRVCLLDYDEDNRCNFYHKLSICTTGTRYDREAILYSASYMLEKAIACTERKALEEGNDPSEYRVNAVLDYRGANLRCKDQILPISIALEVVELIKDHHPDRLWTIYMIDAPFLARFAWPVFRPFVNHIVEGGVKFVTGRKQILKTLGPKYLHCHRADNLDMDKFFQLPYDKTYGEVHGSELEY